MWIVNLMKANHQYDSGLTYVGVTFFLTTALFYSCLILENDGYCKSGNIAEPISINCFHNESCLREELFNPINKVKHLFEVLTTVPINDYYLNHYSDAYGCFKMFHVDLSFVLAFNQERDVYKNLGATNENSETDKVFSASVNDAVFQSLARNSMYLDIS